VLIERNDDAILPTGATVLQAGDRMTVLADDAGTAVTHQALRYLT
jgi:Trk K+ transport system NAD-binding subunit